MPISWHQILGRAASENQPQSFPSQSSPVLCRSSWTSASSWWVFFYAFIHLILSCLAPEHFTVISDKLSIFFWSLAAPHIMDILSRDAICWRPSWFFRWSVQWKLLIKYRVAIFLPSQLKGWLLAKSPLPVAGIIKGILKESYMLIRFMNCSRIIWTHYAKEQMCHIDWKDYRFKNSASNAKNIK